MQQHLRSEKKITNGLLVVTGGRATLNYIPKRKPTAQKLLTKPHAKGRRGLSVHNGNQDYKLCPEVNYDCHRVNFHGTYACSANFKRIPIQNLTKIRQTVQSLILSDEWTD
jgi:hypothetical protein